MPRRPKPPEKQPKRPRGAGSVFKRKDGRWVASLTLGYDTDPKTGKRRRISQDTYHHDDKAAYRWLDRTRLELESGKYIQPDKITVSQYITDWLTDVIRPTKEPLTYQTYLSIATAHIVPQIGAISLQKLTPAQGQGMLNRMASEGCSVPVIRYTKVVLGAALKQAVAWGMVSRNIASLLVVPSHRSREMQVFSREEARTFLDATVGHPLHAAFVIATVLGLRVGEYLSLRWSDLDINKGTLRVRTTVQHVTGKGRVVKQTKTRSSERTVPLPRVVLDALHERRAVQAQERIEAGAKWQPNDYIFTNPAGRVMVSDGLRRIYYRIRDGAELPPIRLHDLRHTAATLMIANGIPIPTVAKILGHRTPVVTMSVYAHVIAEMEATAVAKLDEIWG